MEHVITQLDSSLQISWLEFFLNEKTIEKCLKHKNRTLMKGKEETRDMIFLLEICLKHGDSLHEVKVFKQRKIN